MGGNAIAGGKSITIWNLLALLAVLAGAAVTLGSGELWMRHWATTGIRMPLDDWYDIQLPAGKSLVYYESLHSVPASGIVLKEGVPRDFQVPRSLAEGLEQGRVERPADRFPLSPVVEDVSYRLVMGGQAGRALWEIDLPKAGSFELRAINANYRSDAEIPADDRIVFCKEPDTLAEALMTRRVIHITGAVITIVLAIILYVKHGRALAYARGQH